MKKKLFLGIDTSNYMTSICFIDEDRMVVHEGRKLLEVRKGEIGLKQSEAVFQHIKNLPELFKQIDMNDYVVGSIAVSKAPRPKEGSYMPVFLSGLAVAESMASTFNLPLYYTTHQEGHIAAGFYSIENKPKFKEFIGVHISGGTSEIIYVQQDNNGYDIKEIGGTLDLHAGQLVDRIGVASGLQFPSGQFLEIIAHNSNRDFKRIPSSVKGSSFHFSGAEAEAKRRIEQGEAKEDIARAIEHVIAVTLEKALKNALESGLPKEILMVGGVAQNQYIRDYLQSRLENSIINANLYFANKKYSGDNAFGVANIALNKYMGS